MAVSGEYKSRAFEFRSNEKMEVSRQIYDQVVSVRHLYTKEDIIRGFIVLVFHNHFYTSPLYISPGFSLTVFEFLT